LSIEEEILDATTEEGRAKIEQLKQAAESEGAPDPE